MNRSVKIALFGLLGGLVCAAVLRGQYPGLAGMAGFFIFGFLATAGLATFATKESAR